MRKNSRIRAAKDGRPAGGHPGGWHSCAGEQASPWELQPHTRETAVSREKASRLEKAEGKRALIPRPADFCLTACTGLWESP